MQWKMKSGIRPPLTACSGYDWQVRASWQQWEMLELYNGVLYRQYINPKASHLCLQLVIMTLSALRHLHDSPTAGHLGQAKTWKQVQLRYY